MKTAKDILDEVKDLIEPNEGIMALAEQALSNSQFCIMDNNDYSQSYRCECLDSALCDNPNFMMACLQTRSVDELGSIAVEIYNENAIANGGE